MGAVRSHTKFWLCKSKEESNQLEGSSLVTAFLREKLVNPLPLSRY